MQLAAGGGGEAAEREGEDANGERTEPTSGAMARGGAEHFGVGADVMRERAGAEQDHEHVGEGEGQQEAPEAGRDLGLEA